MVRLSPLGLLCALGARIVAHAATAADSTYSESGDEMPHDTFISLINATPYRWTRVYQHSHQMGGWDSAWPEHLDPGRSFEMLTERRRGISISDSAAEVRYRLEGTARPLGLQVEYRRGHRHRVWVRFCDELETGNRGRGSEVELGFLRRPGGVGFLLAGSEEGGFVSNDGPVPWMRASLPDVGHLPLRELAVPRSHHAGMWKAVSPVLLGNAANTLTQTEDLWEQLTGGGVRVLDVRATYVWREFRESHVSNLGFLGWQGMIGAGIEEMIDVINRFNDEHPGELIVVDVHRDAFACRRLWRDMNEAEILELYRLFRLLRHRVRVPDDEDLTAWPLRRFIGNGTSAVVVRFDQSWLDRAPNGFPGGADGFVTGLQMPYQGSWSDADDVAEMMADQLAQLARLRPDRHRPAFHSQWLISQSPTQTVFLSESIIRINAPAWRTLYHELWGALSDQTYPNWISMDNLHGSQLKAMAMAINLCLGARKCGSLGGKVVGSSVRDRYPPRANGTVPKMVRA